MNLTNHEYEAALLGCVLIDNRVLEEMHIAAPFFDSPDLRTIWKAIESIRAESGEANIVTVGAKLPALASRVAGLTNVASSANAKFYADNLRELASRRGLMKLAREVAERSVEADDVGGIFEHIDRALLEVSGMTEDGYKIVSDYMPGVIDELRKAYERKGALSGVPTGFPELDDKTNGWQPETLNIIGARPGAGKTSIALNMSTAALKAGVKVGFFSAEMSAQSIILRIIADWGTVDHRRMRNGMLGNVEFGKIIEAASSLANANLFLNDRPAISLRDLVSESRKMRRREGVGIIFVDYLSLVSNDRRDVPRHEQVAEISKTLKALSRELTIPVIVLSQLTREAQGERPKLSQLRDSGAVEQDADMVILLHNLGFNDEAKTMVKINLIVEKNRSGATGDIPLLFQPLFMRMREVQERWPEEHKNKWEAKE